MTEFGATFPAMSQVQVERLRPERIADAARTLAHAFVTNPLHAVVFGPAQLSPSLVRGVGLRSAVRVISWLSAWARHDPNEPHSHLGPIGVCPDFQGRRIGHALMDRYCEELDRSGESGYLDTDRPENVTFYQRFGFEVVEEMAVLGVPSYFMARASRGA